MTANHQYQSEAFSAIHERMNALFEIGASNEVTIREATKDPLNPPVQVFS